MTKTVTPDHPADGIGHQTLVAAARSALDAFMVLDLCQVSEPPPRGAGWAEWHDHTFRPAYQNWARTMDHLEKLLEDDFPGCERWALVPVCLRLLTGQGQ